MLLASAGSGSLSVRRTGVFLKRVVSVTDQEIVLVYRTYFPFLGRQGFMIKRLLQLHLLIRGCQLWAMRLLKIWKPHVETDLKSSKICAFSSPKLIGAGHDFRPLVLNFSPHEFEHFSSNRAQHPTQDRQCIVSCGTVGLGRKFSVNHRNDLLDFGVVHTQRVRSQFDKFVNTLNITCA
jgi:hypothetical protein